MSWLWYLGKRRPSSLADHANYNEVQHAQTEPKKHENPRGVEGTSLGKGGDRKKGK